MADEDFTKKKVERAAKAARVVEKRIKEAAETAEEAGWNTEASDLYHWQEEQRKIAVNLEQRLAAMTGSGR